MEALCQRLRDLWAERRRLGLVALGVTWGTLSLSLLLTFGNASYQETSRTIDNFGVNLLRISGGATTKSYRGLASGRGIPLRPQDVKLLRDGVPEARAVTLEYSSNSSNPIRRGSSLINAPLSGSNEVFGDLRRMTPQPGGRFLNRKDVTEHRRVVFLGHRLKQQLFGEGKAVGEEVELLGIPFTVIGVRVAKVEVTGYNGDDREKAYIPESTFRDLKGWTAISFLWVGLREPQGKDSAMRSIRETLAARYRFDPQDEDAIEIQDYLALRDMIHGMLDGNRYFNALVGVLGLLVSMLGVANVMFVMVEERRREIGVMMALGARPQAIVREYLSEGILVTLLGGGLGLALCAALFAGLAGLSIDEEVRAFFGHPRMSLELGAVLVLFLCLAGCLASWFPARRAAALDPVTALREE